LLAVGVGAIAFALVTGMTTPDGGPDWVSIITCAAGVAVLAATAFFDVFHHRTN
jgi:hypothetical protein